jgi:hypothetical protein
MKKRKNKKTLGSRIPESPSKRRFIKKAAIGIALLPYVAPLIESFTLRDAQAKITYSSARGRGKISPGGGKDD